MGCSGEHFTFLPSEIPSEGTRVLMSPILPKMFSKALDLFGLHPTPGMKLEPHVLPLNFMLDVLAPGNKCVKVGDL